MWPVKSISTNGHLEFGSLVQILSFSWWYHISSFIWSSRVHKFWSLNQIDRSGFERTAILYFEAYLKEPLFFWAGMFTFVGSRLMTEKLVNTKFERDSLSQSGIIETNIHPYTLTRKNKYIYIRVRTYIHTNIHTYTECPSRKGQYSGRSSYRSF
jgi:hypothetical protein